MIVENLSKNNILNETFMFFAFEKENYGNVIK